MRKGAPRPGHKADFQRVILQALTAAANAGADCPTNEILCARIGAVSTATTARYVADLEALGLIRVKRYQRSRQVEIVATGHKTAAPANRTPHWRAA